MSATAIMKNARSSPAYAFGYGLSYTNFMISDLQLNHDRMDADAAECVHASVRVRNIGRCTGKEVVQLYISDVESTLDKPVKELKGFEKIELAPGEEKLVRFTITRQMLESFDPEYGIWACESGLYRILVGNSSDQISWLSRSARQESEYLRLFTAHLPQKAL